MTFEGSAQADFTAFSSAQTRFDFPATDYDDQYQNAGRAQFKPEPSLLARATYPFYSRSCHEDHISHDRNNDAGYPDSLLFAEGKPLCHPCVVEVKAWWSFTTDMFKQIWTDLDPESTVQDDGSVRWSSGDSTGCLLKQASMLLTSCCLYRAEIYQ